MKKNLFIAISIIITMPSQMHAMKRTHVIKKNITQKKKFTAQKIDIFFLLKNIHNTVPEILDHIAEFLTFNDIESDQEFIERTKTMIPKSLQKFSYKDFPENSSILLSAYCPNNILCGMLHDYLDSNKQPLLIIFDTRKRQELLKKGCDQKRYKTIAVSRDGTTFATIYEEFYLDSKKQMLTIENIDTKKIDLHDVSNCFMPPKISEFPEIAFNKQGTNIILNDTNFSYRQSIYLPESQKIKSWQHKIIPLTIASSEDQITTTANCKDQNQKKLENYFIQRGICRNLTLQLSEK